MEKSKQNDSVEDFVNIVGAICDKLSKSDIDFEGETAKEEGRFSVIFKMKTKEMSDASISNLSQS